MTLEGDSTEVELHYTTVSSLVRKVTVDHASIEDSEFDLQDVAGIAADLDSDNEFPELGICCDGTNSHGEWYRDEGAPWEHVEAKIGDKVVWREEVREINMHPATAAFDMVRTGKPDQARAYLIDTRTAGSRAEARKVAREYLLLLDELVAADRAAAAAAKAREA